MNAVFNHHDRLRMIWLRGLLIACGCLLPYSQALGQIIDFTGIAVETPDLTGELSHASYMTHFSVGSTSAGSTPSGADRAFGNFGGGTTYSLADSFAVMQIGPATVDKNVVYYGSSMTPAPPLPGSLSDGSAYMNDLNVTTAIRRTESDYHFVFTGIDAASIGDGVPDIFLVSIKDHNGGDIFELLDGSGNPVGSAYTSGDGDWVQQGNKIVSINRWNYKQMREFGPEHSQNLYTLGFDLGIFLGADTTAADLAANGLELLINLEGINNIAFVAFNTSTFDVPEAGTLLPMILVVCGHVLFSRRRRHGSSPPGGGES